MSGLLDRQRFNRDHRWAPDRMSDYLDGELSRTLRARMERHLGECHECRRLLEGLRRTLSALHRLAGAGGGSGGANAVEIAAAVRLRLGDPG